MQSVFAKFEAPNYQYRYNGKIHLDSIAGGVPRDPLVLQGHLRRKTGEPDDLIRQEIANTMVERGIAIEEAIEEIASEKGHIGFREDPEHGLWIRGAQLKACLVESASIAAMADRIKHVGWGKSQKAGIIKWLKEHVFVVEDRLYLGTTEPSTTEQSFIAKLTAKGPVSAIQYTDVVYDCDIGFTIVSDYEFDEKDWAAIWLTAEKNGLGAARKMGYGTFVVSGWSPSR